MDKKALINSRILKFPLNIRTDKIFLVQPKINLQSFKSTPDSLKQHLTALERKRSLGAPGESDNRLDCDTITVLYRTLFSGLGFDTYANMKVLR